MCLPPKHFSPGEIIQCINSFPLRKSPGFDLITAEVARQFPKKAILMLTRIINAIIRLSYFPTQWKFSLIILIPKSKKPPHLLSSYRPISLLPFFSRLCEKLVLKRIHPIIKDKNITPDHQFGFRESHSTIHQIHRLVDLISTSLKKKLYCSTIMLDVEQAFDRIWFPGPLLKLRGILPPSYYLFYKSYLENRTFATKVGTKISEIHPINSGVPQGAISFPLLLNIYTADQPSSPHTYVADYADDKLLISIHENHDTASLQLQTHLNSLIPWYTKWRIKLK